VQKALASGGLCPSEHLPELGYWTTLEDFQSPSFRSPSFRIKLQWVPFLQSTVVF